MVTIDILGKGQIFGWSSLIKPHVHTTSAICQEETKVLVMDGAALRFILHKTPHADFEVATNLATLLGDRLRASYRALEPKL